MQLLLLSGNSLRNRDWIYEARDEFADLFDAFYVQNYAHWETGDEWIDLPHELRVLRGKAAEFEPEYGVFAKSIGTVLAIQAAAQGIIKPKWLLLCGIPLGYVKKDFPAFPKLAAETGLPITIVHNRDDKVGTSAAVAEYLKTAFADRKDYTFIETPGDTHDYEDYDLLRAELTRLRG